MAACIIRAIWSEAPPAPAATTISTGLVGSHAMAGAFVIAHAVNAAPAAILRTILCIVSSLCSASVDAWRVFGTRPWSWPRNWIADLQSELDRACVSEEPGFRDRRSDADHLQMCRGVRLRALFKRLHRGFDP